MEKLHCQCCQHRHLFQMISPLKPLGWLKLNCMQSLFWMGEYYFVHKVWFTWRRWPPCPYMVKTHWKSSSPEPRNMETWYIISVMFVQMMILSWQLTFLLKGQIDIPTYLQGKILKSHFFEDCWRLMYHIWHTYFINQEYGTKVYSNGSGDDTYKLPAYHQILNYIVCTVFVFWNYCLKEIKYCLNQMVPVR